MKALPSLSYYALAVLLALCHSPVKAVRRLPEEVQAAADEVLSSIVEPNLRKLSSHKNVQVPLPTSPEEHLVTSLPLLDEGTLPTQHWAGLLPASAEGDKYLFYWLFAPQIEAESSVDQADIPLLIWLNGGPGCSSMDGLFLENGPLRLQQENGSGNYKLVAAEHSWHKIPAYTLYIDQPVGTGLSFTTSGKYPRNDEQVNIDFYHFLQSFLTVHSDKFVTDQTLHRALYFSGESHAGHYIPSMMAYILDQNDNAQANNQIYIPLSGAAIGNGWVDPYWQYAAAQAAYGHGIIGRAQLTALDGKEQQCQAKLDQQQYSSGICFDLLDSIVSQSYGSKSLYKVSQYDVRQTESRRGSRTFPPGHKIVESYLGGACCAQGMTSRTTEQVLEAIHATPSKQAGQVYKECTDPPYNALSHQDGLGVVPQVVQVLEHQPAQGEDKVRLLFFNGVEDLICNHVGNEVFLEKLPWNHREEYVQAPRSAWKSKLTTKDSVKLSGYIKEYENLLYLKVLDAGHMVPMDVPEVALDMMRLLVYGGPNAFSQSPQQLDRGDEEKEIPTVNLLQQEQQQECPTCAVCPTTTTTECPTCPVCPTNVTDLLDTLNSMEKEAEEGAKDESGG